jgi:hypothetical protein
MFKNISFEKKFLVVWKYAQMHKNTFVTTPDSKKYLFRKKVSCVLEVCANASKHAFNHTRW